MKVDKKALAKSLLTVLLLIVINTLANLFYLKKSSGDSGFTVTLDKVLIFLLILLLGIIIYWRESKKKL